MKQKFLLLFASATMLITGCSTQMRTTSPDGVNSITFSLDESGSLNYTIQSGNSTLVEQSSMGVKTQNAGDFTQGLKFVSKTQRVIDETYSLPTGKTSTYVNRANETEYSFQNSEGQMIKIMARGYDDGVAFRYVVEQPGQIMILGEQTQFKIQPQVKTWMMDWRSDYEDFYPSRSISELSDQVRYNYPALMSIGDCWMLLTEASVYDQPATHLTRNDGQFQVAFDKADPQFTVIDRYESPWRTFVIGDNLAEVVQTTLVENLNPASEFVDNKWIKPGVATFPWWGDYMANSSIDTLKMYVDLSAEMGWEWIEFDVSLVGTPFHTSEVWRTTPWLKEFCDYAKSKNVMVYGWDEIKVLDNPTGRDYVYGRYRDLGIQGIKIDYINSDSQYAMSFRDTATRVAADYGLMVSYHGETAPRGQRRKYPHLMTQEGVRGSEYYSFADQVPPSPRHNCTLPYTRNVIGPMDYTPTTFTIRPENPRITTYAHELALPFIFESGWVCMADRPAMYLNSPAKEMLRRVEATWDETRLLDGYPGEYVVMARRKGSSWYIAAINSDTPRTVEVKLDMLKEGQYDFMVYEDPSTDALTNIAVRKESKKAGEILTINLPRNGGFSTVIDL